MTNSNLFFLATCPKVITLFAPPTPNLPSYPHWTSGLSRTGQQNQPSGREFLSNRWQSKRPDLTFLGGTWCLLNLTEWCGRCSREPVTFNLWKYSASACRITVYVNTTKGRISILRVWTFLLILKLQLTVSQNSMYKTKVGLPSFQHFGFGK